MWKVPSRVMNHLKQHLRVWHCKHFAIWRFIKDKQVFIKDRSENKLDMAPVLKGRKLQQQISIQGDDTNASNSPPFPHL